MNTQSPPLPPAALLREADARMTQALDNFFQRSHAPLQDSVLRAISAQMTPSAIATGQTCLDWLNTCPDALSTAFAGQFRLHLARPETFTLRHDSSPAELQPLAVDSQCGTLLLQCATAPLLDTLKHTYTALNQFLCTQDIPELPVAHAAAPPRRTQADAGQAILAHIQSVAAHAGEAGPASGCARLP